MPISLRLGLLHPLLSFTTLLSQVIGILLQEYLQISVMYSIYGGFIPEKNDELPLHVAWLANQARPCIQI
jgi:hypothetical protein